MLLCERVFVFFFRGKSQVNHWLVFLVGVVFDTWCGALVSNGDTEEVVGFGRCSQKSETEIISGSARGGQLVCNLFFSCSNASCPDMRY